MKANIEITEGPRNFSYLVNGVNWSDLMYDFADKVCTALVNEVVAQYNIPDWFIECLGDNDYCDLYWSHESFIRLVKNNKNTKEEYIDDPDDCECTVYKWKLEIEIED